MKLPDKLLFSFKNRTLLNNQLLVKVNVPDRPFHNYVRVLTFTVPISYSLSNLEGGNLLTGVVVSLTTMISFVSQFWYAIFKSIGGTKSLYIC